MSSHHDPLLESNPEAPRPFALFEAFGVECEYMIVDAATLDIRPVADKLLLEAATLPGAEPYFESGTAVPTEVGLGPVSWSNELCAHVIELKTAAPASSLDHVADSFQDSVALANAMLAPMRCVLLPAGMHPWMNPDREMKLWPHGFNEIYAAFDRIFNCKGHGWCNLQSTHLNLPFQGDDEFARLHAAIRALLPIMPALAASSPLIDGATSRSLDNRMAVYARNARTIASVAGDVIPEPVWSQGEYQRVILDRIYADLKPHDPQGILAHEWCNSRGCIARFSRSAIEVRVLDVQECPAADLAILKLVSAVLKWLSEKRSPHQASLRGAAHIEAARDPRPDHRRRGYGHHLRRVVPGRPWPDPHAHAGAAPVAGAGGASGRGVRPGNPRDSRRDLPRGIAGNSHPTTTGRSHRPAGVAVDLCGACPLPGVREVVQGVSLPRAHGDSNAFNASTARVQNARRRSTSAAEGSLLCCTATWQRASPLA